MLQIWAVFQNDDLPDSPFDGLPGQPSSPHHAAYFLYWFYLPLVPLRGDSCRIGCCPQFALAGISLMRPSNVTLQILTYLMHPPP
jgi:hypothetical protein